MKSKAGPLVRVKMPKPDGVVKRGHCYQVAMRNMRPDSNHGRWETLTTRGHTIVCTSKQDACNLVWFMGLSQIGQPPSMPGTIEVGDLRYLDWLLEHYFRIEAIPDAEVGAFDERGCDSKRMQVLYSSVLKGWKPELNDVPRAGQPFAGELAQKVLRDRWRDR